MAKITFSLEADDEIMLIAMQELLSTFSFNSIAPPSFFGFVIRVMLPDTNKSNFAIGIVEDPEKEAAVIEAIFGDDGICQILYNDLAPEFADGILFKFKHRYNESTGLYELNEREEQDLLSMLAKTLDV